jgi:hypothetical protein
MIVKGVKDRENGLMVWTNELRKVVVGKTMHRQAWSFVWRDLGPLPAKPFYTR